MNKNASRMLLVSAWAGMLFGSMSCNASLNAGSSDRSGHQCINRQSELMLKLYWEEQWHGRGNLNPEMASEEERIARGELVKVLARVEYRFWPFIDNPSTSGYRGAILQLLEGERIPCYPQVCEILLVSYTPLISREYLRDEMMVTLIFSSDGKFYDLVDEDGRSGMLGLSNGDGV